MKTINEEIKRVEELLGEERLKQYPRGFDADYTKIIEYIERLNELWKRRPRRFTTV